MPRYIDADALKAKKAYSEERHEYVVPIAEIDWMPAADVAPVRRGEWIWWDDDWFQGIECPVCGDKSCWEKEKTTPSFCQNCGADMRKEHP